jgi:preprotein translocase subunit SecB
MEWQLTKKDSTVEDKPNQAGTASQEQFGIQNIYLKDSSFETPHSPQIFREQWKPQLEVEIANEANQLEENLYEVVLKVTATVKVNEKTAFLVEVHQAGIFAVMGFTPEKLTYALHSFFPNILFPFARETVSNLVTKGGFQPLLLAPVNFDVLYAQRVNQLKQQQNKATVN